jgi:hypothetical protein
VRLLPEGAQRAVVEELKSSLDAREANDDEAEPEGRGEVEQETAGTPSLDEIRTRIAEDVGTGQSVKLARIRLAMLEDCRLPGAGTQTGTRAHYPPAVRPVATRMDGSQTGIASTHFRDYPKWRVP